MCNETIEGKCPCYAILQIIKETTKKTQSKTKSTQTGPTQMVNLSFELCEKSLMKIFKKKFINSVFVNKIEKEFGAIDSQHKFLFIRALVTAVCRSCMNKTSGLDEIKFISLCSLLSVYVNSNQEFELETVFAIKTLQYKKQYQFGKPF